MSISREKLGELNLVDPHKRIRGKKKKVKLKSFTLLTERLENFRWRIKLVIMGTGGIGTCGQIEVRDEKAQRALYYDRHKEEMNQKTTKWQKEHPEKKQVVSSRYYKTHKDQIAKYSKNHRNKMVSLGSFGEEGFSIKLQQQINADGKIYGAGTFSGVHTPEQNRFNILKRKLRDVTILNEWFEGSEAHHMSKDVVIFIPKELHWSVRHNLETGEGTEEINGKALIWARRKSR